jgi:hypothetical protein
MFVQERLVDVTVWLGRLLEYDTSGPRCVNSYHVPSLLDFPTTQVIGFRVS